MILNRNFLRFCRSIFIYRCGYILCDIYQYRTGASALCNIKCFAQGICQILNVLDNKPMLCNRHGNACNIHFLKGILSQHGKCNICRNRYHRHRIHICRCNTRNQIGGAGATGRHTYTYLTCCTSISISGMRCSLLVRSQNMSDFIAMLVQGIINIQDRTSGISENGIHSLFLQTLYYDFRTVQLHDKSPP